MRRILRLLLAAAVLLVPAVVLLPAGPVGATTDNLLNAAGAPAWQANGAVDAIGYANGVVFIGGEFTSVRPPGAPAGTDEVPRHQIAAFDAQTGELLPFNPDFEPYSSNYGVRIQAFATSPDGHTLYVGGNFYTVDGVKRPNIAAFDLSTMTRMSWNPPSPNGEVLAIEAASDGTLYFGGRFTAVGGTPRANAAAYSSDKLLLPWAPQTDDAVRAINISPDGSEVVLGGSFSTVDGVRHRGLMAVDPANGANVAAWGAGPQMSQYFEVYSTAADANALYIGGVDNGGRYGASEFDGTAALNWSDGTVRWSDYCRGDTIALALVGGTLYSGSHVHDCTAVPGAFGDLLALNLGYHHMLAESASTGAVLPWFPNTDAGSSEGDLGPKTMFTDGAQVWYGGTFTEVNHQPQAAFARFAPGPDTTAPSRPGTPTAAVSGAGTVQVQWQGSTDLDDGVLTYNVYRDFGTAPVGSVQTTAKPWSTAAVSFTDKNVPAGTHTYTVEATDGTNLGYRSDASNAVTIAATASPGYAALVKQAGPASYWRLGESAGATVAADSSGRGATATYGSGVAYGVPGAIAGDSDTAVRLDGSTGTLYSTAPVTNPQTYTLEMWFATASRSGGKLIGFGNRQSRSTMYDRHVYMTSSGQLVYGVYVNGMKTVTSSRSYNDGKWHQMVATLGSGGMALYVDGQRVGTNPTASAQVYSGYWHVSGDTLGSGWPLAPRSAYLAGSFDDVAIYPYAMDAGTVAAHYTAALNPPPPPKLAAYPAAVTGDRPTLYWRFGEPSGSVANDASGNDSKGVYRSGVTLGAAGALANDGDTAVISPGTSAVGYSAQSFPAPSTYSIEVWLKTDTTKGGKVFGFENQQTGWGNAYDRQVYLTSAGRLAFGVSSASGKQVVETGAAYNDGAWHDIVATQGAGGMALYVDGQLVGTNPTTDAASYTGFWRVGGGNVTGWPDAPANSAVAGTFDEAAVYPVALTASQVSAHYAAGVG